MIYDRRLPAHARDEWLPLIYTASQQNKGTLIEAFRGASKSSTRSVAWTAFRIGHHPETANLVIQVSDAAARDTCKQIADQYPTTQLIGVEAQGKGEEFFHLMLRTSNLPIEAVTTGRSSKGERFKIGMAPLFQFGRTWVADVETPFLRAF